MDLMLASAAAPYLILLCIMIMQHGSGRKMVVMHACDGGGEEAMTIDNCADAWKGVDHICICISILSELKNWETGTATDDHVSSYMK